MNEIIVFLFKSARKVLLSSSLSGEIVKRGPPRCRNNHTFNSDSSETRSQLLLGLMTIWKLRRRARAARDCKIEFICQAVSMELANINVVTPALRWPRIRTIKFHGSCKFAGRNLIKKV